MRPRPRESWPSAVQPWGWGEDAEGNRCPEWVPRFRTSAIPCGRYFQALRVPYRETEAAQALLGPYGPVLANVLAAV